MTASSMIGRIAAACCILNLTAAAQDQWAECAERWGVRSPPALGCIEHELLPEAWGAWAVRVEVDHKRLAVWAGVVTVWAGADPRVFEAEADTRVKAVSAALVAAIEAAPQPKVTP